MVNSCYYDTLICGSLSIFTTLINRFLLNLIILQSEKVANRSWKSNESDFIKKFFI